MFLVCHAGDQGCTGYHQFACISADLWRAIVTPQIDFFIHSSDHTVGNGAVCFFGKICIRTHRQTYHAAKISISGFSFCSLSGILFTCVFNGYGVGVAILLSGAEDLDALLLLDTLSAV